jgi:hypothetical protein
VVAARGFLVVEATFPVLAFVILSASVSIPATKQDSRRGLCELKDAADADADATVVKDAMLVSTTDCDRWSR